MFGRYQIARGARLEDLPPRVRAAVRQDTRKHTRHCLRPPAEAVTAYLAAPSDRAWAVFRRAYLDAVRGRYDADAAPFDALAAAARAGDLYIGCSCPTRKNPDVSRCHTVLALRFMQERYPDLAVEWPDGGGS